MKKYDFDVCIRSCKTIVSSTPYRGSSLSSRRGRPRPRGSTRVRLLFQELPGLSSSYRPSIPYALNRSLHLMTALGRTPRSSAMSLIRRPCAHPRTILAPSTRRFSNFRLLANLVRASSCSAVHSILSATPGMQVSLPGYWQDKSTWDNWVYYYGLVQLNT